MQAWLQLALNGRSYNINLIINVPDLEAKEPLDDPVGLDVGIVHAMADSNGNFYDQPLLPHDRIKTLRAKQKRLKYKGRQWRKFQKLLRAEYKRISNRIDNWEHHVTKEFAERHSMVVMEDLKHITFVRAPRAPVSIQAKACGPRRG